jgi:hypothetical protein
MSIAYRLGNTMNHVCVVPLLLFGILNPQFNETYHKPPDPRKNHTDHSKQKQVCIPLSFQTIRIRFGGGITGIV